MYDMYPAWDEPAETAARNGTHNSTSNGTENGSSEDANPSTRVEHIRGPRRRASRPGTSPALRAVQASLDRRDNGGDALSGVPSQSPANATRQ